jgi:sarcosine oxidase gamma subunit
VRTTALNEANRSRIAEVTQSSAPSLAGRLSLSSFVLLLSATANAGELTATVVDQNEQARSGVIVEVLGPTKIFTRTDSAGRFVVSLPPGNYVVRVRDNDVTSSFEQSVGDANVTATYKLPR